MKIPAVIIPSMMEKPPMVMMRAPLTPAKSPGRSFTFLAQSAISWVAIMTLAR